MRRSGIPTEPAIQSVHIGDARPFGRTPPIWIAATRLDVLGLVGKDQVLDVTDGNSLPVIEVDRRLAATGMQ
jgi:hypothetical protein